ncbi:hypothetical protein EDD21DRAFT_449212 [Dissophora ornata]|nr:hypothetical protein EDD21DRAFT_449212 [Dissophora ornata]
MTSFDTFHPVPLRRLISMLTNPFYAPEIVDYIGKSIPLWDAQRSSRTEDGVVYIFRPQVILNCTLVSRMWRDIMLPILWHTYDDTARQSFRFVPCAILARYGHLFKIVNMMSYNLNNSFEIEVNSLRIRELVLRSDRYAHNYRLSCKFLRVLDIKADLIKNDQDYHRTDVVHIISPLSSLVKLCLRSYSFQSSELQDILHNKPIVGTLALYSVRVSRFIVLTGISLGSLTVLHVQYCNFAQPILISLIQGAPLLEDFSWWVSKTGFEGVHAISLGIKRLWPMTVKALLGRKDDVFELSLNWVVFDQSSTLLDLVAMMTRLRVLKLGICRCSMDDLDFLQTTLAENTEFMAWISYG